MLNKTFLTMLLAGLSSPVWAVSFNGGLDQTMGSQDYSATNVYAAIGMGGWSIAPELKSYSAKVTDQITSLDVDKRFNTVQARVGYDMRWFGAGVTAGSTLKKDGYSTLFGGADAAFTLSPMGDKHIRRIGGSGRGGAPVGKGIARVDFGGGAMVTRHEQETGTALSISAAKAKLTQSEFHGFVGASVLSVLVSGRYSKFAYDKSLKNAGSNLPLWYWSPVGGHLANTAGGFADNSLNLRVEAPVFPMISPFASYTFTDYAELSPALGGKPGDTRAYAVGVAIGLEMLAVHGTYQHVSSSDPNVKDDNYMSVTAGLRL